MKMDLTNQKFGRLTAKEIVRTVPGKGNIWRCECECGGEKEVPAAYLRNGHTRSCGCLNKEREERLDITGQRWGRLTAVRLVRYEDIEGTGKRRAIWLFRCDCGTEKEIPATQVKHSRTRSCGCLANEHITNLRKGDITGQVFGRLTAIRPTEERDSNGSVVWELSCECGNTTYKTINTLKTGKVLSCECLYKQTRSDTVKYRKDLVAGTSISNIVVSKRLRSNNTSGHTGVWHDKKHDRWHAFINFQGKHYNLGTHPTFQSAVKARRAAEERLHDPAIIAHIETLTEERRKEFAMYLRNNGGTI